MSKRDELKSLLVMYNEQRETLSEKEEEALVVKIIKASPSREISDMIFWDDAYIDDDGRILVDKLCDAVFDLKPIIL